MSTQAVELRNISVKPLGLTYVPTNAGSVAEALEDILAEKSRFQKVEGLSKELTMTLAPSKGSLEVLPKSGRGQSLYIRLDSVLEASAASTKMAIAIQADDPSSSKYTVYGFQFKKKNSGEQRLILDCLTTAANTPRNPSQPALTTQGQPSSANLTSTPSAQQAQEDQQKIKELSDTIDELKLAVAEERAKAAHAEGLRLSGELRRVSAERDAEEAKKNIERLRKEMALAAADMSAELAKMRLDFSEDRANDILGELHELKQIVSQNTEHLELQTQNLAARTTNQNNKQGSSDKFIEIARRISSVANSPNTSTKASAADFSDDLLQDLESKPKDELLRIIAQLRQAKNANHAAIDLLTSNNTGLESENQSLRDQLSALEEELDEVSNEKNLLADTIAALKTGKQPSHPSIINGVARRKSSEGMSIDSTQATDEAIAPSYLSKVKAQESLSNGIKVGSFASIQWSEQGSAEGIDTGSSRDRSGRPSKGSSVIQPTERTNSDGKSRFERDLDNIRASMDSKVSDTDEKATAGTFQHTGPRASYGTAFGGPLGSKFAPGKYGLRGEDDDESTPPASRDASNPALASATAEKSANTATSRKETHEADKSNLDQMLDVLRDDESEPEMLGVSRASFTHNEKNLFEVVLDKTERGGLGLTIAGGTDEQVSAGVDGLFVSDVTTGGTAHKDGRIKAGDQIVEVDGTDLRHVTHAEAVDTLIRTGTIVKMVVCRVDAVDLQPSRADLRAADNAAKVSEGDNAIALTKSTSAHGSTHEVMTQRSGQQLQNNTRGSEGADLAAPLRDKSKEQLVGLQQGSKESVRALEDGNNDARGKEGDEQKKKGAHLSQNNSRDRMNQSVDLEERIDVVVQRVNGGLGFSIAGGKDKPIEAGDPGVYITEILEGGAADLNGNLKVGDRIVAVNGIDVTEELHDFVVQQLAAQGNEVRLQVLRFADFYGLDEQETLVEVDLQKLPGQGCGFSIAGGVDQPVAEGDAGIYISHIDESLADELDGQLLIGDRLVEINGEVVTEVEHKYALDLLEKHDDHVFLVLARVWTNEEELMEIEFERGSGGLGFSISGGTDDPAQPGDSGVYVVQIMDTGSAARDGRLMVGDRIVEVNGHSCEDVTHDDAVSLLQQHSSTIKLLIARFVDADVGQVHQEELEIEFEKMATQGLGFSIVGGTDIQVEDGEPGIFVSEINPKGPAYADGRLQFGDKLLEVNGQSLEMVSHEEAVAVLKSCTSTIRLRVMRFYQEGYGQDEEGEQVLEVALTKLNGSLGFSVAGGIDDPVETGDTGIYITAIIENGAAHENGNFQVGDKILSVNGISMENVEHSECVRALQSSPEVVKIVVSRLPLDYSQQEDLLNEQNA